ncbi:FBLN5 protein, partial [Panurus biarmicus]|nr:FBLN5 protein [Panurus biarmicus]
IDVNECTSENPCTQTCVNTYGSFLCRCEPGYELEADGVNCSVQEFCEFGGNSLRWKPVCRSGILYIFPCFSHSLIPCVLDINECEIRNFTCTSQQTCFNIPGEYKCLDPVRCEEPYLQINENRCMCPAENPGCRDQPFTILYRVMDMVSGRSVPSDIFQMQATTRYPGAYYIFQIKSGNEGREFYMR